MKTLKKLLLTNLIVFIALSVPHPYLFAQEPIKVAFSELVPWKIIEGKRSKGVYVEILRELARGLGKKLKFKRCPLKRWLVMIANGTADWIIRVKDTEKRKQWIHFLKTPYRQIATKSFYVRKGDKKLLLSYEDLYTLKVGVKRGAKYFKKFDKDSKIIKNKITKDTQNFKKLLLGRVDTIILNSEAGAIVFSSPEYQGKIEKAEYYHREKGLRSVGISKK